MTRCICSTAYGYTSAVRKTTRTVENGCQTKFSEGGACGLYVVRGTQTVYSNVKLTAERDADTGGLVWKTESPTPLAGGLLDEHYYFYYPYQARASILGQGAVRLHHYGERVNRARLVLSQVNYYPKPLFLSVCISAI